MSLWPEEAIEAMHGASLALLARAGARVESPAARELLLAAGCTPGSQDRVLIPAGVVEQAVAANARRYTLAARDPQRSLDLDGDPGRTYVHNMGGASDVSDAHSGVCRRATVQDQVRFTRVLHHLTNQHEITPLLQPQDVPDVLEPLYSYLILAWESDKTLGGPGISHAFQGACLREMAQAVTGADGHDGRYPVDLAFSPVSPLTLGGEVTDAMIEAVRRGGVVIEILPCPALATTSPAAISAALAQQNAEVLAGLVLAQAVVPGTPVYYGPRLSAVDPRSGVLASGAPETGVASVAATLLARRYGMACDCYGPATDSKVVDAQFGYEHAFNTLVGLAARPRLLSGIGDLQTGVASCLEALVVDDEVLTYAFYALSQRPWDEDALDVEAMVEGVLGGHGFLGTKHTRRYIRSEFVAPQLSYRGGLEDWVASGRSGVVDLAQEKVAEMLADEPVGLPDDVLAELCRIIDEAARHLGLAEWLDPRRVVAG